MASSAFLEMGYESHRNHPIETVRGKVNIDVYATDTRTSIPTTVICECKYWNKRVDQQVIYAFRSICSDIGAHCGLVISKVGFQSGAKETCQSTNIHLLDFDQFQEKFFGKWREGVCMEIIRMRDSFLPRLYRSTNLADKAFPKYHLFEKVSDYFIFDSKFPFSIVDPRGDIEDTDEIEVRSHRHFFDIVKETYKKIVES